MKYAFSESCSASFLVRVILAALLVFYTGIAAGSEPCDAFANGRVDARLVEVMRDAAHAGRLYRVVPGTSSVGFCVRHFPGQEFRGEFRQLVGGLVLPSASERFGQVLLLIHTTEMEASDPGLEGLVRSQRFMDTDNHPEILFIGRAFEWTGPQQGYIYGDLALRGVTQPVVFDVSMDVLDPGTGELPERIFLKGRGQVNRYDFDMRSNRLTLGKTVRLCLAVEMVNRDD